MKYSLFFCLSIILFSIKSFAPVAWSDYPVYPGSDLGVNYSPAKTTFKVWAPKASEVMLRLYSTGNAGQVLDSINLTKSNNGTWSISITKDLKNLYYTFQVLQEDKWLLESPDIYAKAVGLNGKRGMIVDLSKTNPEGWNRDRRPRFKNYNDIILYELHVRDFSIDPHSGILHKGKFLGLTETGTKNSDGESTGLDHLKELGITHVHLLPSFDFSSIDESAPQLNQYNWGYDPLNYNVPEGSYSTNPYDGNTRIREFKQMIKTFHDNGISVILDVVYNHTANRQSGFNQFVPGYYYRHNVDGSYSNGTGCGNETASERPMMRSFMNWSVAYWAKEYHIDGFRFDLMGIHDVETMNLLSETLYKIDPQVFIYGEGWAAGKSPLPENLRAVKGNVARLKDVAVFSDDIRDGIKGKWNDLTSKGFVSGQAGNAESVKFGIVGSTYHPQVDYSKVNYSKSAWAKEPAQCINYVSCHDDNTLYDRLKISNPGISEDSIIKMDLLSNAIILTSQGIPFLHAGEEMLRTKHGVANSYHSPDSINAIDWSRKTQYAFVNKYYKDLIRLRKDHPAFRMPSNTMIQQHLKFLDTNDPLVIAYMLTDHANNDSWKNILVIFNGNSEKHMLRIPTGKWNIVGEEAGINEHGSGYADGGIIILPATSTILLRQ